MARTKTARIIFAMLAAFTLISMLALCACSSNQSTQNQAAQNTEPAKPLDLTGTWKQTNPNSETTWHEAVIEGNTITINWVMNNGETRSLYWAGTYVAPTTADQSYSWVSENDKEKTSTALLAAGGSTKDFTYENNQLSYSASALGTTTTVKMERV